MLGIFPGRNGKPPHQMWSPCFFRKDKSSDVLPCASAHSLGCHLTPETLEHLRIGGPSTVPPRMSPGPVCSCPRSILFLALAQLSRGMCLGRAPGAAHCLSPVEAAFTLFVAVHTTAVGPGTWEVLTECLHSDQSMRERRCGGIVL